MRTSAPLVDVASSSSEASDARARARAREGTTLARTTEIRRDGTTRAFEGRAARARVDERGESVRWGDAGAGGRAARMWALVNVRTVERRGDGRVVRLTKRDGDAVEFEAVDAEDAAMWERALVSFVRDARGGKGGGESASAVDGEEDGGESNLDDTDEEEVDIRRFRGNATNAASAAREFVPEPSAPTRAGTVDGNDGHVMISVASTDVSGGGHRDALNAVGFGEDERLTNKRPSNTRRPLLQAEGGEVDQLATQFRNSARVTRCDISETGSEMSRSDGSDDDTGSSFGGSNAGEDALVIEAFSRARHGRVKELQKLFSQGVDPRVRDANGLTLIHIACQNNQRRSVKLVLKCTDYKSRPPRLELIDAQTKNGHTGLHFCFAYGYQALGEYLLSLGASDTIVNVHGLSCYEGLEPNDTRETLNTPEMRARAHEARMHRWIESQRPGAMAHDGYRGAPYPHSVVSADGRFPRGGAHVGGYDAPRNRSDPGGYGAYAPRSRSNSEYSDDRSHASFDSSGYPRGRSEYDGPQPTPGPHGHPMPMPYGAMPYGAPPQPYMPMPYAYAAPMAMPVQPMYVPSHYPGMPQGYYGYGDRQDDRRSPSRRYRSRSRDRSPRRDRSRDRERPSRQRSSRARERSLGDGSDSLEGGSERADPYKSSYYSNRAGSPPRDRQRRERRPAKVDVIEATRGAMEKARRGFYSSDDD